MSRQRVLVACVLSQTMSTYLGSALTPGLTTAELLTDKCSVVHTPRLDHYSLFPGTQVTLYILEYCITLAGIYSFFVHLVSCLCSLSFLLIFLFYSFLFLFMFFFLGRLSTIYLPYLGLQVMLTILLY